jgi:hypothetical protein
MVHAKTTRGYMQAQAELSVSFEQTQKEELSLQISKEGAEATLCLQKRSRSLGSSA